MQTLARLTTTIADQIERVQQMKPRMPNTSAGRLEVKSAAFMKSVNSMVRCVMVSTFSIIACSAQDHDPTTALMGETPQTD